MNAFLRIGAALALAAAAGGCSLSSMLGGGGAAPPYLYDLTSDASSSVAPVSARRMSTRKRR